MKKIAAAAVAKKCYYSNISKIILLYFYSSFHESEWTVIRENANSHRRSVKSRSVTWGRAIVYKLFKKQGDLAKCRICSKILSALDGNTTTMRRHAIRFHELEWNDIQVS